MHQEALERQSALRVPVSPHQKKTTLQSPPKTKVVLNQPFINKKMQGSASESYLRVVNQAPNSVTSKQAFDMQFDRNVLQSLEAVACKQRKVAQVVSRAKLDRGALVTTKQKTAVGSTGNELTQEGSETGLPI